MLIDVQLVLKHSNQNIIAEMLWCSSHKECLWDNEMDMVNEKLYEGSGMQTKTVQQGVHF